MPLKTVTIVVGTDRHETIPVVYVGNAETFLASVRAACEQSGTIYTNIPDVVVACQTLMKRREFDFEIILFRDGVQIIYRVDINGDLIEPWPDEFFEIGFHLRFHFNDSVK